MKLPDEVRAVVTGGASGLGRAICLELAARRGRVIIADLDVDRANETAALVESAGGTAAVVRCDVAELADVEAAAAEADRRFGGTDLVVNNAGVAVAGRVGEVPMRDWQWVIDINQWGVIHGCHAFVPRLREQGRGWILNVASSAGFAALPEMAPYNVTKAAVIALSETLYGELAGDGIAVSVLCPTFFQTRLMERFRSPTDRQRQLAEKLFARSTVTAEQIAVDALAALEQGKLHVIPQTDGKVMRLFKRLAPQTYHRMMGAQQARDFIGKLLKRE